MSIEDKVLIVTGGTSGIGDACVRLFTERAAKVVAASNQQEAGEALQEELRGQGREVRFLYTDVTDEESVRQLIDQTVSWHGRVDGIYANAGDWQKGGAPEVTRGDFDQMMGVNVLGPIYLAKHAVPVMEKQGGGVLLVSTSVAAHLGFPSHLLYSASKAAAEALVRNLATDHAGVMRVVGICPGTIDTPLLARTVGAWGKDVEEVYADVRQRIPVRRLGEPRDVAQTAAFLFSDEASYINGTSIVMDGGTLAVPPW